MKEGGGRVRGRVGKFVALVVVAAVAAAAASALVVVVVVASPWHFSSQ